MTTLVGIGNTGDYQKQFFCLIIVRGMNNSEHGRDPILCCSCGGILLSSYEDVFQAASREEMYREPHHNIFISEKSQKQ